MTKSEIEKAIEEICSQMKGPMPNLERALLHEDRCELREKLKNGDFEEEPCEPKS